MNIEIFRLINNIGKDYPFLNPFAIFFVKYTDAIFFSLLIILWFSRIKKNRIMLLIGLIAWGSAKCLGLITKTLHQHFQPFVELKNVNQLISHKIDNSFPSDHAILFFSFCIVFWLYKSRFRWFWLSFAFLISISRIYVGVHYPSDIFVGASIATVMAMVSCIIVPKLKIIDSVLNVYEKTEAEILLKFKRKN
ncbi:MAG: undecaprenyl-diphosphatase [Bacteroidetes bacterium]|nr:undecaprenyl-diphosphatase [Bacteroidota bacterium]